MSVVPGSTGGETLTAETAAESVFGSYLSEFDEEYREDRETPTQAEGEQPEASQAESEEAPEPSEEQDQAESTEQPDEAVEPDGEEPAEAQDQSQRYKVKVDGKEAEVTLEELAKGYSRTADYTRKTQELAGHRKALETETVAARQERAQLAQNLKLLAEAIEEITPKEPNWAQIARDHPDRYAVLHAEWQQGEKDRAEIVKQRAEAEKRVAADRFEAMQETVKVEREKLYTAIPEWKDEKVEKSDKDAMLKFGESMGITADDIRSITDHRHLILLRDAMRYRTSQEKKPAIIKQIEKVRTTKPGDGKMSRTPASALQRSLERLAKDRTREAAQSVFLNAIED